MMSHTYFSTFITGLREIVSEALKKKLKDADVILLLDGLVVYRTNRSLQEIKNIRFLNNTFLLFRLFDNLKDNPLESMIKGVLKNPNTVRKPPNLFLNKLSFRVIASKENQLVSVNKPLVERVENLFKTRLHLQRVDRSKPDIEIWFLWRNEGYGFVGLRLTRTPNYEKTLHKGELRPKLANLMCLASKPSPNDVFLDPFAGFGSIPIERVKAFPYKQVIASEKEPQTFKILENKIRKVRKKITIGKWNALDLVSLKDSSINKIVTDPPWGIFNGQNVDLDDFYTRMLKEFDRLLKPGGLMVVLMAQKDLFEQVLGKLPQFDLLKKYDTLVSGKKASIYKMKKNLGNPRYLSEFFMFSSFSLTSYLFMQLKNCSC